MLTYLDALIAALSVRDAAEVDRLLAHPLARILTAAVRAEVYTMRPDGTDPLAAPLRLMQLRHQTAELLRDAPVIADREESPEAGGPSGLIDVSRQTHATPPRAHRSVRMVQMELPLSA